MNIQLTESIIKHILASFAVIPSHFINRNKTKSLISPEYLLDNRLTFQTEDDVTINNNIWGCQFSADSQELKVLLGDCSQEKDIPEFSMIVQLKDSPTYGIYLLFNDFLNSSIDSRPLISCSMDGKSWINCNTYLQATFLAGMENIKDLNLSWSKCTNYKSQYDSMLSFIQYHGAFYGDAI